MKTAITPCPWCKTEAILTRCMGVGYRVACNAPIFGDKPCRVEGPVCSSRAKAVIEWNRVACLVPNAQHHQPADKEIA
jgi:hypothetical protein